MIRRKITQGKLPLVLDQTGLERPESGLELFNFVVNENRFSSHTSSFIPHHWHREWELFYMADGEIRVEAGGQSRTLRAGEGCFINAGVLHAFFAPDSPGVYHSFVFDAGIVGGTPGSIFDTRYVRPVLESGLSFLPFPHKGEDPRFSRYFEQAFEACRDEPVGYEFQVREALAQIILLILESGGRGPSEKLSAIREERVKEMLRWLNAHLAEKISVGGLARAVNIGERECHRLFKQYLHCGPIEYLNRRRLLAAASQLTSTAQPVTEIALECGFDTPSYFAKLFKRLTGFSPSEYRRAVRGEEDREGKLSEESPAK